MTMNLYAAWIGFLLGAVAGASSGLFFARDDWLGGYADWRRRMIRLGHVSFFGIGFLNLGFALTVRALDLKTEVGVWLPADLLILGAITMPIVCYLSACRKGFRHLFFLPAGAITVALTVFAWRLVST